MIAPALIFIVSILGVVFAFSQPVTSDLILLAGPSAIASVILLLREAQRWLAKQDKYNAPKAVVIDGSNVMYWFDGTPRIEPVQDVVHHLSRLGFAPEVFFDANAGYLFAGQYLGSKPLGRLLNLPTGSVTVVPKGDAADPYILHAAQDTDAIIITNDNYRDWVSQFPLASEPGRLIKGTFQEGELCFDLPTTGTNPNAG